MITREIIADLLGKEIFQNYYLFLDYWSLVHITMGALIFISLTKLLKNKSKIFIYLLVLVFLWEGFEFTFYGILKSDLFRREIPLDIIWDIAYGMIGGFIASKVMDKYMDVK